MHTHEHQSSAADYGKSFIIGIILNIGYVAVEVFYGLTINSSALLADAGHNFSDVISLVLAWCAILLSHKRATGQFSYGFRKSTILASMVNGLLIVGASGFILYDALQKIQNPVEIPGNTMMIVAGIGIVINTGTALLFMKGRKGDLNIKGAFLHMAADAAVTLGVLVGGLLIKLTGAYWVDPALSFIIVGVILYSAWGLLVDSVKLVLDAVPKDINLEQVKQYLENIDCVEEVHDLHIWALSTTETALTAHLVVPEGCQDQFIYDTRDELKKRFGIDHSTLQIEHTLADEEYRHDKV